MSDKPTPYAKGLSGRKVGRPEGSTTTPSALLRNEMKACASTMGKVRRLIEEQIQEVSSLLKAASLSDRLAAMETLTGVMEKLNKTMEGGAKYLMTAKDGSATSTDGAVSTQALIDQFTGDPKY